MNRPAAGQSCEQVAQPTTTPTSDRVGADRSGPRPAVLLRFRLGELTATAEAVAAAHSARIQVLEVVLRHLGGDWGDVDDDARASNDDAVTTGGPLRSEYPLAGTGDTVIITTDADRRHTTVTLGSQLEAGL